MKETIAKLVQHDPTFSITENGSIVHDYFEQNKEAEGVVIVDGEIPVGILMRNDFYREIGKQYGYSIYMKRNITLIMKSDIVCVDITCDMVKLGFIAMDRSKDNLYDHIIVLENAHYAGIISISKFLIEMSQTKEREIELLNKQQQILKQANEVEKLHRMEIEQINASIKNLLDNSGQGFLSFGSDLKISEEHSKECGEIFGFSITNMNIMEVFNNFLEKETILLMKNVFTNVFNEQDRIRNKIYLSILPQEVIIKENYIKIEYKLIDNLSKKSVMIILTNITEKRALELKTAEEKNNVKLIIKAVSCKAEINQAIHALSDFFNDGIWQLINGEKDKRTIIYDIYRMVHTMKGDFSLNYFYHTSEQLHKLENALAEMIKNIDTMRSGDIQQFVQKVNFDNLLEKDVKIISEALGTQYFEEDDIFTVSKTRFAEIEKDIRRTFMGYEQTIMLKLLNSLLFPNIKDIIRNYNDYTKEVAEKLGKNLQDFNISGHDVYIDRNKYSLFTKSIVHIFRNIVDHGIEVPEDRSASGKSEYGKIACHIEKHNEKFIINITDDGKGINIDGIRKKAMEKELYTESEINNLSKEEILEAIFLDGFSTKNSVDMLSGRGVGLAAVRSELEKLGGTIKVDSQMDKYTSFTLVVPNIR